MPKMTQKQAMLVDLKNSGLTEADAKHMKLKPLSAQVIYNTYDIDTEAPGYLIPYLDEHNKVIPDMWRIKMFNELVQEKKTEGSFIGKSKKKKPKYLQKIGTQPQVYFTPWGLVHKDLRKLYKSWSEALVDPECPIWITEGEKKAAKACKEGILCIALGGVWSFQSKKTETYLIKQLKEIEWRDREVNVIYDSDAAYKEDVHFALERFGQVLLQEGAFVRMGFFASSGPDEKIGLDDFLLKHPASKLLDPEEDEHLFELISPAICERFMWMNQRFAIIESMGAIVDFEGNKNDGAAYAMYKLNNTTFAVFDYLRLRGFDANDKPFNKSLLREWLKWPNAKRYRDLTFKPGCDSRIDNMLNIWRPVGIEPSNHKPTLLHSVLRPYFRLLDHVFKNEGPEVRQYFEQWLAYPLQQITNGQSDVKMFAVFIMAGDQGCGKSFVGEVIKQLYGIRGANIHADSLTGAFNSLLEGRLFIVGDEVTGEMHKSSANKIKTLITSPTILLNRKNIPEYDIDNILNFFLTTNEHNAYYIEKGDRRMCVVDCFNIGKLTENEYKELNDVYMTEEFKSALLQYLLNVDTSKFNPKSAPPMTSGKSSMEYHSHGEAYQVVGDALLHPDDMRDGADFYTASALRDILFNDPLGKRETIKSIGAALRRLGYKEFTTHPLAGKYRLFCIRNEEEWSKIHSKRGGAAKIIEHYENTVLRKDLNSRFERGAKGAVVKLDDHRTKTPRRGQKKNE